MGKHPAPTRRAALATFACLGAVSLSGTAVAAQPASPVPVLWIAYLRARGVYTVILQKSYEARARLPWWAKSGPGFLDHEGRYSGHNVAWPAIQDAALPAIGEKRFIRPSPTSIEENYRIFVALGGDDLAVAYRDRQLAALNDRRTAADIEEAKVGLLEIDEQADQTSDAAYDAGEAFESIMANGPDVTAARIMVDLIQNCFDEEAAENNGRMAMAAVALAGLLPHLTGDLAIDAAEVVSDRSRTLRAMRFYRGIDASGATLPIINYDGSQV